MSEQYRYWCEQCGYVKKSSVWKASGGQMYHGPKACGPIYTIPVAAFVAYDNEIMTPETSKQLQEIEKQRKLRRKT